MEEHPKKAQQCSGPYGAEMKKRKQSKYEQLEDAGCGCGGMEALGERKSRVERNSRRKIKHQKKRQTERQEERKRASLRGCQRVRER